MKIGPLEIRLSRERQSRKPAEQKKRQVRYVTLLAVVFGALALSFVTVNWPKLTRIASEPVCARICHFIQPEFKSWQKSAHAQLSCYDCHIEDFYFGLSAKKMETGFSRVTLTLRDSYERPLNANSDYSQNKIPSERCMKCHAVSNRSISPESGLKMSKEAIIKHLNAGMNCATCHNRIAHKGSEIFEPTKTWRKGFEYKNFMKMKEGCWRCHSDSKAYMDKATLKLIVNGKKAPKACTTCHYDDFLWENADKCERGCHESEFLRKLISGSGGIKAGR